MLPDEWSSQIVRWIESKQCFQTAYLFGSRAKGNNRLYSDIDIGIEVVGSEFQSVVGIWMFGKPLWNVELSGMFPVLIDLQIANPEIADEIVAPAIRDHGILLFDRMV